MNDGAQGMLDILSPFGIFAIPLLIALLVWTAVIKGIALWKAARNGHTAWFVALLIVNTLGILELIYIFGFSKQTPVSESSPAGA